MVSLLYLVPTGFGVSIPVPVAAPMGWVSNWAVGVGMPGMVVEAVPMVVVGVGSNPVVQLVPSSVDSPGAVPNLVIVPSHLLEEYSKSVVVSFPRSVGVAPSSVGEVAPYFYLHWGIYIDLVDYHSA